MAALAAVSVDPLQADAMRSVRERRNRRSRLIVSMSFRLVIPRRVALPQISLPLRQPAFILQCKPVNKLSDRGTDAPSPVLSRFSRACFLAPRQMNDAREPCRSAVHSRGVFRPLAESVAPTLVLIRVKYFSIRILIVRDHVSRFHKSVALKI